MTKRWLLAIALLAVPPNLASGGSIRLSPTSEGTRLIQSVSLPPVESLVPPGSPYFGVLFNLRDGRVGTDRDSILDFALTLPAGATIISATLTLTIAGAQQTGGTPASLNVDGSGDADGLVTLADFHRPSTPLGNTWLLPNSDSPWSLELSRTIEATNLVRSLYDAAMPFAAFHLAVPTQGNVSVWDRSSAHPAELVISYHTPEPPSLALIGLGAGLLGFLARLAPRPGRVRAREPAPDTPPHV